MPSDLRGSLRRDLDGYSYARDYRQQSHEEAGCLGEEIGCTSQHNTPSGTGKITIAGSVEVLDQIEKAIKPLLYRANR